MTYPTASHRVMAEGSKPRAMAKRKKKRRETACRRAMAYLLMTCPRRCRLATTALADFTVKFGGRAAWYRHGALGSASALPVHGAPGSARRMHGEHFQLWVRDTAAHPISPSTEGASGVRPAKVWSPRRPRLDAVLLRGQWGNLCPLVFRGKRARTEASAAARGRDALIALL